MMSIPLGTANPSRLNVPARSLSRSSSNSSLNSATPSEWSSNPGGNNFIGADGLLSVPSTVPSSRTRKNSEDNKLTKNISRSPTSVSNSSEQETIASNTDPLGRQAFKALKPHSRTAIGRISYPLSKVPQVAVLDLAIQYKKSDENGADVREPVRRRKFLKLAVSEWLKTLPIEDSDKGLASIKIGIEAKVENTRIEARIAFPVKSQNHKERIINAIDKNESALMSIGAPTKGGESKGTIYCKATVNDEVRVGDQCILHILQGVSRKPDLLRRFQADKVVDSRLPDVPEQGNASESSVFELRLRTQPSFDPNDKFVHLDFDLVPCLPEISASDLLVKLFGTDKPNEDVIEKNLIALRYTLRGLHARCTYKPDVRITENRAKIRTLTTDDKSGRGFQIQDVQLHSVPTFELGDEKVRMSVKDYFGDVPLNEALPFVRDGTGAWIPLELLTFEGVQPLRSFGHRNEVIRNEARNFLKSYGVGLLRDTGLMLIHSCGTLSSDPSQTWLKTSQPEYFNTTPKMMSFVHKPTNEKKIKTTIGIVQVNSSAESDACVENLHDGLEHRYTMVVRKQVNAATLINYSSMINIKGTDLLLVIIENTNRPKKESEETIARLHRTAETEIGIPIICTTSTRLQERMNGVIVPKDYIPTSLCAKINYLLGHTKVDQSSLCDIIKGGNVIVVGAHLAQMGNGKEHCPSIAAMASSTDASGLQYAGSVRLQGATMAGTREPKLDIDRFEDMMLELFEQWTHQDEPPSRMIFFRDSINFGNAISRAEVRKIQQAYKAAFPKLRTKLELAYVVVNKNTALTYDYVNASEIAEVVPVDDYLATGDTNAKHRYYAVHVDMADMPKARLADIISPKTPSGRTGALNSSSQLNPYSRTSKALPLKYASKLAKRVHSYFRFDKKLPEITHEKPKDPEAFAIFAKQQADAVESVKKFLKITEARQLPWKKELDGTTFFL